MWVAGWTLLCFDRVGSFTSFLWLCHVSPLIHMNSMRLLSEYLAVMKRMYMCLKSFRLETYGRLTYVGEKDGNISLQKWNSWQPRGYFPYTLLERGLFFLACLSHLIKVKSFSLSGSLYQWLSACVHTNLQQLIDSYIRWPNLSSCIKRILPGNLAGTWLDNFAAL